MLDHRYYHLFNGAVAEAKHEEGIGGGLNTIIHAVHNPHLTKTAMFLVQFSYIHPYVILQLLTVAVGNRLGEIHTFHESSISLLQQQPRRSLG